MGSRQYFVETAMIRTGLKTNAAASHGAQAHAKKKPMVAVFRSAAGAVLPTEQAQHLASVTLDEVARI